MSKIFKNMLPYWKGLIIVVALLVVQAWCDLSLPAYTSDIIDVGIQNKGKNGIDQIEFQLAPSNYVVMFNQDELGGLLTGSLSVINNLFGK